jgi:dUTP pyrophosphatase
MSISVKVSFTSKEAKELYNGKLEYATNGSSGFDLRATQWDTNITNCVLFSQERTLIKTGIKIKIPSEYEIQIRPRSGLALKHGLTIVNAPGTIDSDYYKEISVILLNTGKECIELKLGDRIAQAVLCPIVKAQFNYVDDIEDITDRGGFGSTGIS